MTFLDTVAPRKTGEPGTNVLKRAEAYALDRDEGDPIRRALLAFLEQAEGNVDRFRTNVETWFDLAPAGRAVLVRPARAGVAHPHDGQAGARQRRLSRYSSCSTRSIRSSCALIIARMKVWLMRR